MAENDELLRKELNSIYTPLSVAKEEIWKRWNDKKLRKKVEDFLGGDIPETFKKKPSTCLARHVATPNFELIRFLDLSKLIDIEPICHEYTSDKFSTKNPDKYYLGKLFFHNGIGRKLGEKICSMKVVDFDKYDGQALDKLKTLWGENFVNFHHRLLNSFFPSLKRINCDESAWVKRNGKTPEKFYHKFLALFICFGILFEDFLENKNEKEFTNNIVLPSLRKLENFFRLKPLIVKLYPFESENDLHRNFYPYSLANIIKK